MFRLVLCLKLLLVVPGFCSEMSQEAYVWQRSWSDRLKSAIESESSEVDGLTVLFAEATPADPFGAALVEVDFDSLRATGRPITLALRLNWNASYGVKRSFESGFSSLVLYAIRESRRNGLEPAAVEIDFDCPTSKLELYAAELRALRDQLDDVPLSITTLPTWMDRPKAFRELVTGADRFVLQVHSIQRAGQVDSQVTLCEPSQATRWTMEAGRFGRPFHVALPTYGYRLAYDASGELVEVAGEDASSIDDPAWTYRVIRAEPEAMSALVRELAAARPESCLGVIWYRLPIGGERLNWDAVTWRAVKRGRMATAVWQAEVRPEEQGLFRLELLQPARMAAYPPKEVRVSWEETATALAWDGQRNYEVSKTPDGVLIWKWPERMEAPLLEKGTRWTIGWLRLDRDVKLKLFLDDETN